MDPLLCLGRAKGRGTPTGCLDHPRDGREPYVEICSVFFYCLCMHRSKCIIPRQSTKPDVQKVSLSLTTSSSRAGEKIKRGKHRWVRNDTEFLIESKTTTFLRQSYELSYLTWKCMVEKTVSNMMMKNICFEYLISNRSCLVSSPHVSCVRISDLSMPIWLLKYPCYVCFSTFCEIYQM